MPKKNTPASEVQKKKNNIPIVLPPVDPDEPQLPETTDPDIIPEEDEFETPPYEAPEPGEGP